MTDYQKPEETGLPAANVLIYTLENGATGVVRPSGTEPKIKTYFTTLGKDLACLLYTSLSLEKAPYAAYFLGKGPQRLSNPLCGIR